MGGTLSKGILKAFERVSTLFWLLRKLDEEFEAKNDFLDMSSEKWFWHC